VQLNSPASIPNLLWAWQKWVVFRRSQAARRENHQQHHPLFPVHKHPFSTKLSISEHRYTLIHDHLAVSPDGPDPGGRNRRHFVTRIGMDGLRIEHCYIGYMTRRNPSAAVQMKDCCRLSRYLMNGIFEA
jgi:hypothetical protein